MKRQARRIAAFTLLVSCLLGCGGAERGASVAAAADVAAPMPARMPATAATAAAIAMSASAPAQSTAVALQIPSTHPRLWYAAQPGTAGAARLTRAKAYRAAHPLPLNDWRPSQRMVHHALDSLLSGNPGNAQSGCVAAVNWLTGSNFPQTGFNFPSIDEARWSGEHAILIYDWCHAQIPAQTRAKIISAWNARLADLNDNGWGGVYQPANNYFWGYLRNGLLWGIASYHENPQAQAFVDHALALRYRDPAGTAAPGSAFARWYERFGIGGVFLEGGQYGPYMLAYPVVAFAAARDYGVDAWAAVPFWRDAVWHLHYAAVPAKTRKYDGAAPRHELFPFNDDQFFVEGGSAENGEYADFLGAMMLRDPVAGYARQARDWIARIGLTPSWWVAAELASLAVPGAAPALPLDYYAAGAKFLYGRRSGDPNATAFLLQLGGVNAFLDDGSPKFFDNGGVGHSHADAGSFQLWRKGRWLSRETTGYSIEADGIRGWNNGPLVDPMEGVAHNTVLFEGRGQIGGDLLRGLPRVLRLQSTADFAYAAVDLTDAYRADVDQPWEMDEDWPFAERAIREFVYLRALDALVILDRLQSGSDSLQPAYAGYGGPHLSAEQVRKTFLLHATGSGGNQAGNPFSLGAATATATVGDQRLDLRTLLPANPGYRVIQEGGAIGQFRLEYDVGGAAQSYLLNVIGLRDDGEAAVAAALEDLGSGWRVQLSHPTRGSASVQLSKGASSSGGSVRIGGGAEIALRGDVQPFAIGDHGVFWEGSAPPEPVMRTGGPLPPLPVAAGAAAAAAAERRHD